MCISRKLTRIFVPDAFLRVQMGAEYQRASGHKNHFRKSVKTIIKLFIFGLLLFLLVILFLFLANILLAAKPSENYQNLQKNASVVIAFGFGIQENKDSSLSAGPANDSIMKWLMDNTNPKYIIAQKGCQISKYCNKNAQIVEMHPHGRKYVNTFEASIFALQKLDSLNTNEILPNHNVVIVAHSDQLRRASWIIKKIYDNKYPGSAFIFITPDLPQMPYLDKSSQLHTKNEYLYMLVELFISRPRDYFRILAGNW
jgi:hypothetical protein